MKTMKMMARLAALLLIVALLAGCDGKSTSYDGAYYKEDSFNNAAYDREETTWAEAAVPAEMAFEGKTAEAGSGAASGNGADVSQNTKGQKIIYTTYMDVETEHYDEYLAAVYQKLAEVGGHEDGSYIYNRGGGYRSAELTLRVPSDQRQAFIEGVSGLANVISVNNSSRNITLQYVDTESRIEALRTEQARLLELMEQATEMSDIIAIEDKLTDIRYEVQSYQTMKNGFDYDVDYSTVTMNIYEVQKEVPAGDDTLGSRISRGFKQQLYRVGEGAKDVLVWLASNFIVVLIWLAVLYVVVRLFLLLKRRTTDRMPKKSRRKKGEPEVTETPEAISENEDPTR